MIAWGVGFLLVIVICAIFKIKSQGLATVILLGPVAYGVGRFVLLLFGLNI